MGLRKRLGGMAEKAINKALDDLFEGDAITNKIKEFLGTELRDKIKANYVDLIDGEDDIPNI